jgi:hypothetical protein
MGPEMSRAERAVRANIHIVLPSGGGRPGRRSHGLGPTAVRGPGRRGGAAAPAIRLCSTLAQATLEGKVVIYYYSYPASRVSGHCPAGLGKPGPTGKPPLLLRLPTGQTQALSHGGNRK